MIQSTKRAVLLSAVAIQAVGLRDHFLAMRAGNHRQSTHSRRDLTGVKYPFTEVCVKATLLVSVLVSAAGVLSATPSCQNGTLAFYQSTYGSTGCTIGNFLFSNFSYVSVSAFANPVTASSINITTVDGVNGPQLDFSANWQVSVLGTSEAGILFHVDSLDTGFGLSSVNLSLDGSRSGVSAASVTEVDCLGGLLAPFTGAGSIACLGGGVRADTTAGLPAGSNVNASSTVSFQPVAFHADVLKDILLTGVLGSATITDLGQSFTEAAVPEPQTFSMLFVGIAALRSLRRKK